MTIDEYRPQAKIQMSEQKFLDLQDYTQKRKKALTFLHKNLLMYL